MTVAYTNICRCLCFNMVYIVVNSPQDNLKYVRYDVPTCYALKQATHIKDAFPQDALKAHAKDCEESHYGQQEDSNNQEYNGGLPKSTCDLCKVCSVWAALNRLLL